MSLQMQQIGDCILYCGNCLDILEKLKGRTMVDSIISDPPYARDVYLRMRKPDSNGGKRLHRIKNGDSITAMRHGAIGCVDDLLQPVSALMAELTRRWCLIFSDVESCHRWRIALEENGLKYVRTGAWVKPHSMPQMTGDRPAVGFEVCTIAHAPGRMRWNGGGHPAVWKHNVCRADRPDHPCPKPLPLMKQLIELFSDTGETILDPFMGSGTTGVACMSMGRRFIGIEIDTKYFDDACRRLEEASKQSDMFLPAPKAEQLDMENML